MSIQAFAQLRDTMQQLFQRIAALEASDAEKTRQIEQLQRTTANIGGTRPRKDAQ